MRGGGFPGRPGKLPPVGRCFPRPAPDRPPARPFCRRAAGRSAPVQRAISGWWGGPGRRRRSAGPGDAGVRRAPRPSGRSRRSSPTAPVGRCPAPAGSCPRWRPRRCRPARRSRRAASRSRDRPRRGPRRRCPAVRSRAAAAWGGRRSGRRGRPGRRALEAVALVDHGDRGALGDVDVHGVRPAARDLGTLHGRDPPPRGPGSRRGRGGRAGCRWVRRPRARCGRRRASRCRSR